MPIAPPSRKLLPIRLYLAVSLLLHGLCFVAAIVLAPTFIQAPKIESTIVMTQLVSLPAHKTGNGTTSQPAALPTISKPAPQPLLRPTPPTAAAPSINNNSPPIKRIETAPEAPSAPVSSTQQSKGSAASKQETGSQPTAQTNAVTGGNRGVPQEIAFGSASGPAFRRQTAPAYPALAKRRNKEGIVLLRLSISETGQLTRLEVLEDPGYGFAEAAQEAISNSSFTPAHHNGKPIAVRAILPIRFNLR